MNQNLGILESQEQLRTALALGADRAVLIESDSLLEPLGIANSAQRYAH